MIDDIKKEGFWCKSEIFNGVKHRTRSYEAWIGMLRRCKIGGEFQMKRPSYIGCSISDNFKDFQRFTDWYVTQKGYGQKGYHLDKDLLVTHNKRYAEESCAIIPAALNSFIVANDSCRGLYPVGVSFDTKHSKIRASISSNGYQKHLGYFNTVGEASEVYKVAKEAEAYRWYERLKAGEFVVDERVIERMRTWTLPVE